MSPYALFSGLYFEAPVCVKLSPTSYRRRNTRSGEMIKMGIFWNHSSFRTTMITPIMAGGLRLISVRHGFK